MSRPNRNQLLSLSPLDGRYLEQLDGFAEACFSEYALIHKRAEIELQWLRHLVVHPKIGGAKRSATAELEEVAASFSLGDAAEVKRIERRINHDVKAVELWIHKRIEESALAKHSSLIHFGCTSSDINNLAISLMVRDAIKDWLLPSLAKIQADLRKLSLKYASCPMLGRTHGQPASPTTLGKEFSVYAHRLRKAMDTLGKINLEGKMNGAVGNYNAHLVAYPGVDWIRLTGSFVRKLGLIPNTHTTQIEPYDSIAEVFDCISRTNSMLIDLCRDMWAYISMDYLRQRHDRNEVGSSTMPHKVNPIDFENAEGNLGVSSALLRHLSAVLPISRLQRDLTDSTATRNIGVALGHGLVGLQSLRRGLGKIAANRAKMRADLEENAQVLAEAVMSVMRALGDADAYETMRNKTRGKGAISLEELRRIIGELPLPRRERERLLSLEPKSYLGLAEELARL